MKLPVILTLLVSSALLAVGCSGGSDSFDPNYKTEIKQTEAEKQKEQEIMAGQPAPGTIDPKTGATTPGGSAPAGDALKVPGKGG